MSRFELVSEDSHLVRIIDHLSAAKQVAVDIESNGFFRYPERICLVQLATLEKAWLVDPLAIEDFQPLGALLEDRSILKVFHAADYDLRSIDRDWGFRVVNIFDTSVAAALAGCKRLGLKSILQEYAGVELAKDKKLQRSDWTIRPLNTKALNYAANDVLHLVRVGQVLTERLLKLRRLDWANEEFTRLEQIRHISPDPELKFLSVKGSSNLDAKGLAVLRSLVEFRELEAKRLDRPLFKVMQDSALVDLSSNPSSNLSSIKGLGRYRRPIPSNALRGAINRGLASRPVILSKQVDGKDRNNSPDWKQVLDRLRRLKSWRSQKGRELELDPSLLWPTDSLQRLARHPDSLQIELDGHQVRNWQRQEFAEELGQVLGEFG